MKKVILTGFEPFLNHEANPSELIVSALDEKVINGLQVKSVVLPVSFQRAAEIMKKLIKEEDPAAIVMLGLAGKRTAISLERIAINVMDGPEDNDGVVMSDQPIHEQGPAAYFSTLPLREIEAGVKEHDSHVYVSNTAGTYVCNALMYETLHELKRLEKRVPSGFIHIPFTKELNEANPLTHENLYQAITVLLQKLSLSIQASVSR
ncbi:pyroglutamyl-peptidase I [Shouchella hunanensis]|uniref:Pyroglutamyl-peptidase I n=1 Tax=Shouchella hunanensis TaxID=766894 RepID=A0ABY7W8R7_9BACI|nr:pyroglutamyl-peptidase I [Shouchella hunanensis]WDF04456.1 pyroglutamyl-peptidase I [Shouchella hunanensis]